MEIKNMKNNVYKRTETEDGTVYEYRRVWNRNRTAWSEISWKNGVMTNACAGGIIEKGSHNSG